MAQIVRRDSQLPQFGGGGVGPGQLPIAFRSDVLSGRLDDSQVKVLVVGQEGAQDESLAHRFFVGGTGGRMQYSSHDEPLHCHRT
jgi:uracil-DNA glycosylase